MMTDQRTLRDLRVLLGGVRDAGPFTHIFVLSGERISPYRRAPAQTESIPKVRAGDFMYGGTMQSSGMSNGPNL